MPFCLECKREYLSGEKTCVFCNTELVEKLPVDAPREVISGEPGAIDAEPGEMVTVVAFDHLAEARSVRNMLIDNGILCLLSDGSNSVDGPEFTLHVRPEDVFRANSLLIPYIENQDTEDTEPVESKEQPVIEKIKHCPQCGNTQILAIPASFFGVDKWQCQNCGHEWKKGKDN